MKYIKVSWTSFFVPQAENKSATLLQRVTISSVEDEK